MDTTTTKTTNNYRNTTITARSSRNRRTVGARAVLAALVTATGGLIPVAAEAGPVEDVERSCVADASGSADSLERWADHCRGVAGEYRETYHDCMRNAPGSADSRERWVDHCAAESAEAAAAR